jgi:hypothetical protein
MSARKNRKARTPEVTARPKPISEELTSKPATEPGLSVDPEDLGAHFLNEATEQQNFESSQGGDAPELSIVGGAGSDDALPGPNFEQDHDVWEQTVDMALESGGEEEARSAASREGTEQNQGLGGVDQDLDMSEPGIHDASLLDEEADALGETRVPRVNAEEDARNAKRRSRGDVGASRGGETGR